MPDELSLSEVLAPFLPPEESRYQKALTSAADRVEEETGSRPPVIFNSDLSPAELDIVLEYTKAEDKKLRQWMESPSTQSLPTIPPCNVSIPAPAPPSAYDPVSSACRKSVLELIRESSPKQKSPSALALAELLLTRVYVARYNGELYYREHDCCVFRHLPSSEYRRFIFHFLYPEIAASGSANLLRSISEFLVNHPTIQFSATTESTGLLYFLNGALEIQADKLRPIGQFDFFTTYINACYPSGSIPLAPHFTRFLRDISGGDSTIIQTIWEMLGYLLVPGNQAKALFVLQGVGNSGKSVLGALVKSFFNREAVAELDILRLGTRFDPSALLNARINVFMDLPGGRLSQHAVSMLKSITGDDGIPVEGKFRDVAFATLSCKFLFGTNHPITLPEPDDAFLSRLVVIPFRFSVPREKQDKQLLNKLIQEAPTIIAHALQAYQTLASRNFQFLLGPGEAGVNFCGHADSGSALQAFLTQYCIFDEASATPTSLLYEAFCQFCRDNNFSVIANSAFFSRQLNAYCAGRITNKKMRIQGISQNCYVGIRLKKQEVGLDV